MNDFFLNKTPKEIHEYYLKELDERKKNGTTQIFSFEDIYTPNSDSYKDTKLSDIDDDINEIDELIVEFKKLNKDDKLVIMNKIKELNNKSLNN